uniref:Uncharacterized protein n=1 Tax=Globodera rostochiensis TaxID=31243 RepID=A0A914HG82_GLORO
MLSSSPTSGSRQHLLVHADPNTRGESVDGVEVEGHETEETPIRAPYSSNDLSKRRILAYSVGHFYNDLCASMWFTYLLIFMEKVVSLRSWQAGLLMFIGQVTDAVSTPLVGMLSDLSFLPGFLRRFGRRKSWHIIGTFCVTFSFPLIFSGCLLCDWVPFLRLFWFVPPIMLFQFGWAAVQISHLAMIPELTSSEHTRMSMTSYRYGFTVAANLFVFACLFLFLAQDKDTSKIKPSDLANFRNLGLIAVVFGSVVTALFYAGVSEPSSGQRRMSRLNSESGSHELERMSWHSWFKQRHFYQVAALYVFSRVYINISQIYLSFYITQTHHRAKQFVALLPLTAYLASMLASLVLGSTPRAGGKLLFMSGAFVGALNCAAFYHPPPWPGIGLVLFGIAALLGITQALLLICSLNATAQLINRNTESGAFVYGAMSFLDKLSNGVIVWLLELYNPSCRTSGAGHALACANFYRDVMAFVPGGCVCAILFILFGMDIRGLGQRGTQQQRSGKIRRGDEGDLMAENGRETEQDISRLHSIGPAFDLSHPAPAIPTLAEHSEEPSNPNIIRLP